jgi:tRNA(Ile)-lysidine synthase
MIDKINKTIENYSIAKKGDKIILCVSGGPDSTAMLYALHAIAKKRDFKLFIVHVNHCLRAAESDKDQAYVQKIARLLNIPFLFSKENTLEVSKREKVSVETAARNIRYRFFIETAKKLGVGIIATAHTKDDQAETVLMRIIRGTGLRGLCGIPVKNRIGDVIVTRPLIDVRREEVLKYLAAKKIRPRIDRSNSEVKFFRNRIRMELIPILSKIYNSEIKNVLSSLATLTQSDYEYLDLVHKNIFSRVSCVKEGKMVTIPLGYFKDKHDSVKRGLIRHALRSLCDNLDNIEYRHWKEVESLIENRPIKSIVNLPNNIVIKKTGKALVFSLYKKTGQQAIRDPISIFHVPCKVSFGRHIFYMTRSKNMPGFSGKPKNTEYISIKNTDFPLILRAHKKGDRIKPLGMNNYKKVSDIFIDNKVPLSRRKNIPILVSSSGEILCIFGIRISETCKIEKTAGNRFKLELLTR